MKLLIELAKCITVKTILTIQFNCFICFVSGLRNSIKHIWYDYNNRNDQKQCLENVSSKRIVNISFKHVFRKGYYNVRNTKQIYVVITFLKCFGNISTTFLKR